MSLDQILESLAEAKNDLWQETSQKWLTDETTSSESPAEICPIYTEQKNSTIHWFLAQEGCMGKTVASAWTAELLTSRGRNVIVIDADPSKDSLSQFTTLDARKFVLLDEDGELDTDAMDAFVQEMMESESDFIVDPGAAGFDRLAAYLKRDSVIDYMAENGKNVCVHTFVVGGERQDGTVEIARAFLEHMPQEIQLVLWINPKFGKIKHENEFSAWFADRGVRIVRIPDVHQGSLGKNVDFVLENKLTFGEVADVSRDKLPDLAKQRLSSFWRKLSAEIVAATECGV